MLQICTTINTLAKLLIKKIVVLLESATLKTITMQDVQVNGALYLNNLAALNLSTYLFCTGCVTMAGYVTEWPVS